MITYQRYVPAVLFAVGLGVVIAFGNYWIAGQVDDIAAAFPPAATEQRQAPRDDGTAALRQALTDLEPIFAEMNNQLVITITSLEALDSSIAALNVTIRGMQ